MKTFPLASSATETVLPLDRASDAATCGQKAATLAKLRRAGCRVPDGFVIPAGVDPNADRLRVALERLGAGPWAVRSSGIAEDLEDASFAGQYDTVLGVTTMDEVLGAVARVRASGGSANVAAYRQSHAEGDAGGVAVLIQGGGICPRCGAHYRSRWRAFSSIDRRARIRHPRRRRRGLRHDQARIVTVDGAAGRVELTEQGGASVADYASSSRPAAFR